MTTVIIVSVLTDVELGPLSLPPTRTEIPTSEAFADQSKNEIDRVGQDVVGKDISIMQYRPKGPTHPINTRARAQNQHVMTPNAVSQCSNKW